MKRRELLKTIAALVAVVPLAGLPVSAAAQSKYPDKVIKVIVPYLAGGSIDLVARLISPGLESRLGGTIIVENRTGAGGTTGSDAVAKAEPDGYTFLFTAQGPIATSVQVLKNVPYDPQTAFEPVALVLEMPNVFIAHSSVPFRTVKEFVAYAKENPGRLTYGSQGIGTTPHLTGAMVGQRLGIEMLHVPYKGFPPLLADVKAGRVNMMFVDTINALRHVPSKELLAIAVAGERRSAALPDVPTFPELGYPDIVAKPFFAMYAPRGTPLAIRQRVADDIREVLKLPEVAKRLNDLGGEISGAGPEQLAARMKDEYSTWGELIRKIGLYKAR